MFSDPCDDIPKPLNGIAECIKTNDGVKQCNLFCVPGYDFALDDSVYVLSKNQSTRVLTCSPTNHSWTPIVVPDCSRELL